MSKQKKRSRKNEAITIFTAPAIQITLSLDGVTMIKQNVKPTGEYFGIKYLLPSNFDYEDLQRWRVKHEAIISQFRKQPNDK